MSIIFMSACNKKETVKDNKDDKELFYIEQPETKKSLVYIHLIPTLNKCEFISQSIFNGETDINQEYDEFEYSIKKDNLILRSKTTSLYDMNLKIKGIELLRTKNENGYKTIKYKLSEMKEINTKIKSLGKLSVKLKDEEKKQQIEIDKLNTLNELRSKLSNNATDLKTKVESLNNKSFSLDKINEELTKVKDQYNKWLNASQDDKDYQRCNVDYAITNVEYQYDSNITFDVTQTKTDIEEINKILDSIKSILNDYKLLNDKEYENKNLDDLLDSTNKSIKNIDSKANKYLKDGKDILNESYKYK